MNLSSASVVRLVLIAGIGILLAVLPPFMGSFYINVLTQGLIYGMFAMALNLLLGHTGLPSMGHSAFFGMAAYTVAILTTHGFRNFWLDLLAGIVMSGLIAVIFGLIVLRTSGIYFLIITTALGQCLWGLAMGWRDVSGGDEGIPGIPRPELGLPWSLDDPASFYYLVLVFFVLASLVLYRIVRSPFGLSLVGIRERENRMSILGYNVWLHKYVAYILSGMLSGLAGVLVAYCNGHVSPSELSFIISAEVLLMAILGGSGFLFGPAIGAGVIIFIRYLVSAYTTHWLMVLGAVYVITIYYAPSGILGSLSGIIRKRIATWSA